MAEGTVEFIYSTAPITINSLVDTYSTIFYKQDWYREEQFASTPLQSGTYRLGSIRSDIPSSLTRPPAIACVWAYVTTYLRKGKLLWQDNYVWCSDLDNQGDRVYVGKCGPNGLFEIHRHISLKPHHKYIDFSFTP